MTIEKTESNPGSSAPDTEACKERRENAKKIARKYVLLTGGVGVIPVPLFDQVSIGALQGKMIYDLGQLYGVKIARYRTKAIILAILGGAHAQWIPRFIVGNITLLVPGVNVVAMLITRPALAGAITYAIAKVFIKQFESGHTLEDFDTEQAKKDLAKELK